MAQAIEEGKDEVASLQAQLASSGSHDDQLSQLQKDAADKARKIQVPLASNAYIHMYTHTHARTHTQYCSCSSYM